MGNMAKSRKSQGALFVNTEHGEVPATGATQSAAGNGQADTNAGAATGTTSEGTESKRKGKRPTTDRRTFATAEEARAAGKLAGAERWKLWEVGCGRLGVMYL